MFTIKNVKLTATLRFQFASFIIMANLGVYIFYLTRKLSGGLLATASIVNNLFCNGYDTFNNCTALLANHGM